MISKTNNITTIFSSKENIEKYKHLQYTEWVFKIIKSVYLNYEIKTVNYYLFKKLNIFNIYPKDINYYYRLYYATTNLTWFYSLKKQRKLWKIKYFNYSKFQSIKFIKNIFNKCYKYDFFYHRILMHKYIFKKINLLLYYKHRDIKKFLKIYRLYNHRHNYFYKYKFLKFFNKYNKREEKALFHTYKNNLLRIFKESRQTHWTATNKETLNKRTYCNFLPKFIKNQELYVKTALILILQQIKLTKSWKHSILLIELFFFNYSKAFFKLNKGIILQFPKQGIIASYSKLQKRKASKRLWEQRKRQYLFIQSKTKLWMKKRKNFYKKIEFNFSQISFLQNYYHYDVYTKTLCIFKNIDWHLLILKMRQFSFVLKLTKWRFKA